MTDLYKYLPAFLRLRDSLYSEGLDEPGTKPILERLVELIASEFDASDELIQEMFKLTDVDEVDPAYFKHLSYLVGTMIGSDVNEDFARFLMRNIVYFYKIKGTHESWRVSWEWQGERPPIVHELWKQTPQEIGNYSLEESPTFPLKSARVDFTFCTGSCESFCETACEYTCEPTVETGQLVTRTEGKRLIGLVDKQRPIHVLLRSEVLDVPISDAGPVPADTIGHFPGVSGDVEDWKGSEVIGSPNDPWFSGYDALGIEVVCVSACESACQACCEIGCECGPCESVCQVGSCEMDCTSSCEFNCEWACENSCQFGCTNAGAEGPGLCLSICQTACQETCQTACQNVCQTACQAICENISSLQLPHHEEEHEH